MKYNGIGMASHIVKVSTANFIKSFALSLSKGANS